MGSLCLSLAGPLRCESLSQIQSQVLIIPPAIELLVTSSLIFTNWYSGRRFLLLTAEGWIYFTLALLDLLSHTIPAVRDSLQIFRIIDMTIGASSFLPVFFYTFFIFLYTRAVLIDILPSRFRSLSKFLILVFIPLIVASNEVASFIGISYRDIKIQGLTTLAIGFNNQRDRSLWTFISNLTLALLTVFQAVNFSLAFVRVIRASVTQHRMEQTSTDSTYIFNGVGWIAGGLKLGAIETVIGFALDGFSGAITRRSIRLISRACLVIGVAKGVDSFRQVPDEMTETKRFRIGNPRLSTFVQLSPTATAFHATPRAQPDSSGPRTTEGLPGMNQFAALREERPQQRVTIHFEAGAPTLHMRFSALDLPSPATIVEKVKSQPPSEWGNGQSHRRASSYYPSSIMSRYTDIPSVPAVQTPIYNRHTRAMSDYSMYPDSLASVRELAAQFPGIPPRVTDPSKPVSKADALPWEDPYRPATSTLTRGKSSASHSSIGAIQTISLSASNSLSRRKPVPRISDNIDPFEDDGETEVEIEVERAPTNISATHNSLPISVSQDRSSDYVLHDSTYGSGYKIGLSPHTSANNTPITSVSRFTQTLTSPESYPTTPGKEDPFAYDDVLTSGKTQGHDYPDDAAKYFIVPDDMIQESGLRSADLDATVVRIKETMGSTQIKQVGNAPRRYTPAPMRSSRSGLLRGSVYIEPIMIPPKQTGMPVIIQENYNSSLDSWY